MDLEGEGGRYSTRLDKAWEIWGPSGGYLAALALRAAGKCAEVAQPDVSRPFERTRDGKPLFAFWNNMSCRRPDGEGEGDADRSVIKEWVRFEPTPSFEDPFVDAARPLILLDTFGWPALYQRYKGADYVAPNLDTSVWFHQSTANSEWLLINHECPVAEDGLLGVSGRVWNADGHLLASGSAQLCCIPKEGRG
jgi:hypothetical protein